MNEFCAVPRAAYNARRLSDRYGLSPGGPVCGPGGGAAGPF